MVTPSEGALGGIDFSEEQRRELAEKSRAKEVNFTFGSEKRREVTRLVHEKMLGRMGKAKQAARKMAMEKREREEKDARERSDGGNGTNAEAPTTSTATPQSPPAPTVAPTQREQQQQQQQTPSPTPSSRNAAANENNENDDDWDLPPQNFPVRPNALDCEFYVKTGKCKYGETCKFNHPPGLHYRRV